MSGAPKRLHEEGGHSTPSKRPLDDSSIYSNPTGKLIQTSSSDFHGSFEHNLDGRFAKAPRIEPRDDKRPSLVHRLPIGSTNFMDHPISSDSRLEPKQNKDARDTKADDRDAKADARDAYSDSRIEFLANKVENDVKTDSRADENEIRADRRVHTDYKSDLKFDKDIHPATSHFAWKDNKDHRGKRYFEQPADNTEWRFPRPGLQNTDENPKVLTAVEERNSRDAHETTGENKIDPKSEDKFRDKDRKKKDEKHRDFSARDNDRNDRRISMQLGSSSVERREVQREDREPEKWDRERKDSQKDKEGNDREKDPVRKEPSAALEKENVVMEKTASDGAVKSAEHESTATEPKTLKDDTWKAHDRDPKDKKRERDVDAVDRHEQRSRYNDKESDDTGAEGDIEKDKEVFGSGVQQRRRMVRSRGGGQASQREPRFRSRMRDGEV